MKPFYARDLTGGSCAGNGEMINAGNRLEIRLKQELKVNAKAPEYRQKIVAAAMTMSCANGPDAVVNTINLIADNFIQATRGPGRINLVETLNKVLEKYQPQH